MFPNDRSKTIFTTIVWYVFCLHKRLYVDFTLVDSARVHLQASSQEESYINASYVDVSAKIPSFKIFLEIYILFIY